MTASRKDTERLIGKHPNRRFYDTQTSTYITLADAEQFVMETEELCVVDVKSGGSLTRSILLQIILEEETSDMPVFSGAMLAQIVRFCDNIMQGVMGMYLKKNIQTFVGIQSKLTEDSKGLYSDNTFNPDTRSQFMNMQGPTMQGMMSNYIEQSKNLFVQIQERMQSRVKNIFGTFPFNQPPERK